ncbi:molybdopterin oxidoreductase [Spirochaetia bacterium]|nr:molybdopterin oxidoreductase [Spirochaetia bacterium]
MNKEMVCVICPNSCLLTVSTENDKGQINVKNNGCPRGIEFAAREMTNPERILTSTVRMRNGALPLISVRSDRPVQKAELINLVKQLDNLIIDAPVSGGQVLVPSMGANKVNIIATREVGSKQGEI